MTLTAAILAALALTLSILLLIVAKIVRDASRADTYRLNRMHDKFVRDLSKHLRTAIGAEVDSDRRALYEGILGRVDAHQDAVGAFMDETKERMDKRMNNKSKKK